MLQRLNRYATALPSDAVHSELLTALFNKPLVHGTDRTNQLINGLHAVGLS
jgi:hypothetical protein